ncbi:MAG TPA: PA domain-containing protein [Candidatus Angelobacter sp.]|nr:PA domain-containing protein [Candidatus Angelobacter sp.]
MKKSTAVFFALLFALVMLAPANLAFAGAKITIVNNNAPGVGFNDPSTRAPVGGNTGTTLGQQRLNAFQFAADVWGSTIDSPVEIKIRAAFVPLTCTPTAAVLGSAGTTNIFSDFGSVGFFPGAQFPATWYHFALADKLAGAELLPATPHISANFNSSIGVVPTCLTGADWYYGFDNNHGTANIDLVTVLLHEFAHGLGFSQFASVTSGAEILNQTDIFGRQILDNTTGKTWDIMTNAERKASAINPRNVAFTGNTVTNAIPVVLAKGFPLLKVTSPAAIAGDYQVGTASFGAPLASPGVSGSVVLATDAANAAGPSTTDGCSTINNAAQVTGKIALVDRGTCGFIVKALNVQIAGAIGVLIADNVAGSPPAGLGGADPTITIPAVRISLSDGNLIKAQLGTGVNVTLTNDLTRFAGADARGLGLLYTPNPVQPGSTISHWDTIETPNQLMEPAINGDLTHSVKPPQDMTLSLLRDVGWFADEDNDGVNDNADQCHGTDLTAATVVIGGRDSGVPNPLFATGCTITDLVNKCAAANPKDSRFRNCVNDLTKDLRDAGTITQEQREAIRRAANDNAGPK